MTANGGHDRNAHPGDRRPALAGAARQAPARACATNPAPRRVRAARATLIAWAGLSVTAITLPSRVAAEAPQAGAAPGAERFAATRREDLRSRVLVLEGRALVRTPAAVMRFQPETETWTTLAAEDGLPPPPLLSLRQAGEDLWVTGPGASVTDPRYDDWQFYPPEEAWAGAWVYAAESDDDYAYAATERGMARFDRYILEWEPLVDPREEKAPVWDVAVGDERVWFAFTGGVAEYRKQTESFRVDRQLGSLEAPDVLALRQTTGYLWAITREGLARYDKQLETWTSFRTGIDLPDTRLHQVTASGEDLWLACDDGIWRFRADCGIWRRDEACEQMPGSRVYALSVQNGFWVVTDQAFAWYEEASGRWIDFTAHLPQLTPSPSIDLAWVGDALLVAGEDRIVTALREGATSPRLFTYRGEPIAASSRAAGRAAGGEAVREARSWRPFLDESGVGVRHSDEEYLLLKGGATVYVQNDHDEDGSGDDGFGTLFSETRYDLTLSGRTGGGRVVSGYYDTTDPDNETYLLSYRGTREDVLRSASAGELDQQFFNTELGPETGIRGATARLELGPRSEQTRRRRVTADAWVGERRTFPGRHVFYEHQPVYRLRHQHLVPESEILRIDREELLPVTDYTIDWENGIFILADHVLLDEDTAIEVTYTYEEQDEDVSTRPAAEDPLLVASQVGLAPSDLLFAGVGATGWTDTAGRDAMSVDANARFEAKGDGYLLRISPEIALSRHEAPAKQVSSNQAASGANIRAASEGAATADAEQGVARALSLQGRYRGLEVTATHRDLGEDFVTLEDRRTLLGRLREESRVEARWNLPHDLQATLDWNRVASDSVGAEPTGPDSTGANSVPDLRNAGGEGSENLLIGGLWLRRGGFPNLGVRHGQVWVDSLGHRQEKRITRGELEINPDPARLRGLGIQRLWLRAYVQRNDRRQEDDADRPVGERRVTDLSFVRLNGSAGTPLSWNLDLENRFTYRPDGALASGLSRRQSVDLSLQTRPHASVDALLGWEAERDLDYRERGGSDGFTAKRDWVVTSLLYPGRVHTALLPLSFRIEARVGQAEEGAAGTPHPSSAVLWRPADARDRRTESEDGLLESRLQVLPWLRLIDRFERERDTASAQAYTDREVARFENRFEIRPSAGLLTLRYVHTRTEEQTRADATLETATTTRRGAAEWSQVWGRGISTYFVLDAARTRAPYPKPTWEVSPQTRVTYRHSALRLDASAGVHYSYVETYTGAGDGSPARRTDQRGVRLDTSIRIQPLRILTLKLLYNLELPQVGAQTHELDLRLMIRA